MNLNIIAVNNNFPSHRYEERNQDSDHYLQNNGSYQLSLTSGWYAPCATTGLMARSTVLLSSGGEEQCAEESEGPTSIAGANSKFRAIMKISESRCNRASGNVFENSFNRHIERHGIGLSEPRILLRIELTRHRSSINYATSRRGRFYIHRADCPRSQCAKR